MTQSTDASSEFIWPPVIFGAAFLAAYAAGGWRALPLAAPGAPRMAALAAGIVILALGALVALAAEIRFLRAGTATLPIRPSSVLVRDGIYRCSRNPMYLGMSLALAGFGLAANSLWYVIALPVAMTAVLKLAIKPEEAYLERVFGRDYLDYKARVRRWL